MTETFLRPSHRGIARQMLMGGFMNIAGFGFALYIAIICYPGISASSDLLMSLRTGQVSMSNIGEGSLHIAVPVMLAALFIFARHGVLKVVHQHVLFLILLFMFSNLVLVFSLVSGNTATAGPQAAQYLLTVIVFFLCLCFWQARPQDIDIALTMAFLTLVAFLIAGAVMQGFHDYRWVGLIHPNHYARYAFIALILHSIVMQRVSLSIFILSFIASYMVSARTIMIGIALFYVAYLLLTLRGIPAAVERKRARFNSAVWILGISVIGLAGGFFLVDMNKILSRLSTDLAIFDTDRGVLSGFTGRSDSWNAFFESIPNFVFHGYGFRSGRYELHTVHSGILSYFMDFGLLLGSALLFAVVARALYLVVAGRVLQHNRMLICGLAITTTLIIQCFEPDNFNIGFIGSFFFMLVLAYTTPTIHGSEASSKNMPHIPRTKLQFYAASEGAHRK